MRNFLSKNSTLIIFLVAAGFFVFAFNLHNGLFWDDDDWIINNPAVHSLSWSNIKFWFTHNTLAGIGLKSNYYRPFLFFTFAINYVIGGIKPFGYHLLSNLIHIGNAILIFYILFLATRKKLVAFLTASFFLIHPLQTEAVTYISGRGDLLTAFFMLSALLLFFLAERRGFSWRSWQKWLSLVFLVLALLSRETAIIFPFLLAVFYIAFLSQDYFLRALKNTFFKILPYFVVVFSYGILRLTALNFKNTLNFYDQPNIYSSHLYVRIFTFLKVLLVYFKLLIVPTGLHMERSMDPQLSLWNWPVLLGGLIVLGLIFLLFYLYPVRDRSPQDGRSRAFGGAVSNGVYRKEPQSLTTNYQLQTTNFRVWFFGIGWFFVALAPVSGITPINALIYEQWLYLPMVGFWFVVSYYLAELIVFLKNNHRRILSGILVAALAGYSVFFIAQSIKRNVLWGKPIPFYEDILKYEPDSVRINNNLGNMYYNEKNIAKAEEFYRKAVAEEDIFPQPHFNLGSILQARSDFFGAVQEYKKALEIDPNFYYAYQNLASVYAQQGDLNNAALMLEKAKELRPQDPRIYYNLGLVYLTQGKKDLALENLNSALKYSTSDPQISAEAKKLLEKLGE